MNTSNISFLVECRSQGVLHPAFEEDEIQLIILGGVLGAIVGFIQLFTLFAQCGPSVDSGVQSSCHQIGKTAAFLTVDQTLAGGIPQECLYNITMLTVS